MKEVRVTEGSTVKTETLHLQERSHHCHTRTHTRVWWTRVEGAPGTIRRLKGLGIGRDDLI